MSHQTGGGHPSQYLIDVPQTKTLCGINPGHAPELSSAWIPTAEAAPALFPAGQTQEGGVRVAVQLFALTASRSFATRAQERKGGRVGCCGIMAQIVLWTTTWVVQAAFLLEDTWRVEG